MSTPRPRAVRVLDVSGLPTYAFGDRSLMWWGTFGMMLIEGTVFAIAVVVYFYLREYSFHWPPHRAPPALLFGTLNTVLFLVSAIPNQWTKQVAEKEDLRAVRIGLLVSVAFGVGILVVRVFEFPALNTSWNDSAYGSIVFALLILHTIHLATDFIDTVVLTVLMFTGPLTGKRFVDVSENSLYWWFVVLTWLPIYATLYLAPRVS
ncbi:MAG TPA: cytochrome c oxidase subunit 3 [Steroidobacteraceae bacterium]|nr:cytochrome c oxidase subunit 3 [Steroidobacteraceae bacterium]